MEVPAVEHVPGSGAGANVLKPASRPAVSLAVVAPHVLEAKMLIAAVPICRACWPIASVFDVCAFPA